MKKFISAAFLAAVFAFNISAQYIPQNPNCQQGHINTPVFVCQPPPSGRAAADTDTEKSKTDDSFLTTVRNFVAGFNPFGFFLN